jgi:hypothetical protein
MDFSNLSLAHLRALQDQITTQLKVAAQQDIAMEREEIQAIAQRAGFSLKELVKGGVREEWAGRCAVSQPYQRRTTVDGARSSTEVGQEWISSGKTLDSLHV